LIEIRDQIILLGTGTALSSAKRLSPGILIMLKGKPFLIDCGPGTQRQLAKIPEMEITNLDHIFLTHLHVDHVSDISIILKELLMLKRVREFHVYGPSGTTSFLNVLFSDVFNYLNVVFNFLKSQDCEHGVIFQQEDIRVSVAPTVHGIPSIAFRFDSPEHSITCSGDTAPAPALIDLATGCDYLIHECSFPDGIETGSHVTPKDLIQIANDTNVKNLVLTHFYPVCEAELISMEKIIKQEFSGNVIIGHDLMRIML